MTIAEYSDAELEKDGIRGAWFADGHFAGYDYVRQEWIDTRPACRRDPSRPVGSASNPRASI